jgi:hypothetical protein
MRSRRRFLRYIASLPFVAGLLGAASIVDAAPERSIGIRVVHGWVLTEEDIKQLGLDAG